MRQSGGFASDRTGGRITSADDALHPARGQLFNALHGAGQHRGVPGEGVGDGREERDLRGLHSNGGQGYKDIAAEELAVEQPCPGEARRFHSLYKIGNFWDRSRAGNAERDLYVVWHKNLRGQGPGVGPVCASGIG